jgi:hypothetical protein
MKPGGDREIRFLGNTLALGDWKFFHTESRFELRDAETSARATVVKSLTRPAQRLTGRVFQRTVSDPRPDRPR